MNYQFNVENDKRKSASRYYENENKFEKVKVFKSTIEQVYAIKIPAGTTIYEGPVGYQGGMYLGGMEIEQVFIREPWEISGIIIMKYSK